MKYLPILFVALLVSGCDAPQLDADEIQQKETTELTGEAQKQVGMPSITNFSERRMAKRILEMRDDPKLVTYTYVISLDGKPVFLTKSLGYGLPYSTQYTNPERVESLVNGITLPQPDPNGLFMPTSSSATWVMALSDDGSTSIMYVEPQIIVSPVQLTK